MTAPTDINLGDLVARAAGRGLDATLADQAGATRIRAMRIDSRAVEPGDLFVAMPGTRVDGGTYIEEARRRGAAAILCERRHVPEDFPAVVTGDVPSAAGLLASAFWNDPSESLDLVAVTGTNGKTSSTYLLESIWKSAGREPGIIGTIVERCRAFETPAAMTTPSAIDLQQTLARMRDAGTDSVAIEASSHALDQKRVAGCRFRAGLFTNLTRDHLDYHQTEERYFDAKASLFRRWLGAGSAAVLNADDAKVLSLASELVHLDVWTYSTEPGPSARAKVVSANLSLAGTEARFDLDGTIVEVKSPLVGAANLSNLIAVAAVARATGMDAEAIAAGLAACLPVPGRMERMPSASGAPAVFVDYAHTPDALERSLAALASHRLNGANGAGRVIAVFGCGGDRDRGKRPIMGGIAARLSDVAVLTSDNPRTEDPHAILAEIESGIGARMERRAPEVLAGQNAGGYFVEADRLRAIETAIAIAAPEDVVLIAGKGHEDYQDVAGKKRHFDDREVARATLAARHGSQTSGTSPESTGTSPERGRVVERSE